MSHITSSGDTAARERQIATMRRWSMIGPLPGGHLSVANPKCGFSKYTRNDCNNDTWARKLRPYNRTGDATFPFQ
jgi:hypothetical protein